VTGRETVDARRDQRAVAALERIAVAMETALVELRAVRELLESDRKLAVDPRASGV